MLFILIVRHADNKKALAFHTYKALINAHIFPRIKHFEKPYENDLKGIEH